MHFWWHWYVNAGHLEIETFREPKMKRGTKRLCSPTHLEPGSREEWPGIRSPLLKPIGAGQGVLGRWKIPQRWQLRYLQQSKHRRRPTSPPKNWTRLQPQSVTSQSWKSHKVHVQPSLPDEPHPSGCPTWVPSTWALLCCFKEHNLPIHCSRSFHVSILCASRNQVPGTFPSHLGIQV